MNIDYAFVVFPVFLCIFNIYFHYDVVVSMDICM